jgi:hypothetical protein
MRKRARKPEAEWTPEEEAASDRRLNRLIEEEIGPPSAWDRVQATIARIRANSSTYAEHRRVAEERAEVRTIDNAAPRDMPLPPTRTPQRPSQGRLDATPATTKHQIN